jgi:hypothetical protein
MKAVCDAGCFLFLFPNQSCILQAKVRPLAFAVLLTIFLTYHLLNSVDTGVGRNGAELNH